MGLRLGKRAFHRPTVGPLPIAGDDRAGAVRTVFAMDKNRRRRRCDECKKPFDLGVGWGTQAAQGHGKVFEAAGPRRRFLAGPRVSGETQVDDGPDSESLQTRDSRGVRLGATKERSVHLPKIQDRPGWGDAGRERTATGRCRGARRRIAQRGEQTGRRVYRPWRAGEGLFILFCVLLARGGHRPGTQRCEACAAGGECAVGSRRSTDPPTACGPKRLWAGADAFWARCRQRPLPRQIRAAPQSPWWRLWPGPVRRRGANDRRRSAPVRGTGRRRRISRD